MGSARLLVRQYRANLSLLIGGVLTFGSFQTPLKIEFTIPPDAQSIYVVILMNLSSFEDNIRIF